MYKYIPIFKARNSLEFTNKQREKSPFHSFAHKSVFLFRSFSRSNFYTRTKLTQQSFDIKKPHMVWEVLEKFSTALHAKRKLFTRRRSQLEQTSFLSCSGSIRHRQAQLETNETTSFLRAQKDSAHWIRLGETESALMLNVRSSVCTNKQTHGEIHAQGLPRRTIRRIQVCVLCFSWRNRLPR
jgi:hypothetical protein